MTTYCQLWMGGLEAYMNENFVKNAFSKMGETVSTVKVMRNKYTGEPAGYCFVHFSTDQAALNAMHKLNGKIIPNSQPPIRFKLNHAGIIRGQPMEREFSLWVGDLSADVDDYALYKTFATRYQSIRTAKVIVDSSGFSKGYGFIRFANEEEQKDALIQMTGYCGLGNKSLKVSIAVPKSQKYPMPSSVSDSPTSTATTQMAASSGTAAASTTSVQDYNQYYEQYWQNYAAWQNYGSYYDGTYAQQAATTEPEAVTTDYSTTTTEQQKAATTAETTEQDDDYELVEYDQQVDINQLNQDKLNKELDFWDALEASRWLPVEGLGL